MHCALGSSTFSADSESFVDCRCATGWQPIQDLSMRNGTHRCDMCPPGFYKEIEGDEECVLPCTVNSLSLPGAASLNDCYCIPGTYKAEETGTCNMCFDVGIVCPGNFAYFFTDESGSAKQKVHVMPRSKVGYFLFSNAHSERCTIYTDSGSTCLGGAHFGSQSTRCAAGHTGPLCAACVFGWTRDTSDQPCTPCSSASIVSLVAAMNFDVFCKSVFALILGKLAMQGAFNKKRVDAILLRVFMQWMAVSSVIARFDLSTVEIYGWSKARMESSLDGREAFVDGDRSQSGGATDLNSASFQFQFPSWFKTCMEKVFFFSGSIPSLLPITSQESLECLVDRYVGDVGATTNMPSEAKVLLPAIWWLCLPVFVVIYLIVLMLLVTKVIYPVYRKITAADTNDADDGMLTNIDLERTSTRSASPAHHESPTDYKIFGLARSSLFSHVKADTAPLLWIGIYTIWDEVTVRAFASIHSVTLPLATVDRTPDDSSNELRWMQDVRLKVFEGHHYWVGIVGVIGVIFWSAGFVAVVFVAILRNSKHLEDFQTLRRFGYFYNGFKPDYFWWELLVKRTDVLLTNVVTYTHLVYDVKAKLILYMGIAGFFWAFQNRAQPYDQRSNGLIDRLEGEGLRTRFLTLFCVQILLVVNCPMFVSSIAAILLLYLNAKFVAMMTIIIINEFAAKFVVKKAEPGMPASVDDQKEGDNAKDTVTLVFRKIRALFVKFILPVFSVVHITKKELANKVPRFVWTKPGGDVLVIEHRNRIARVSLQHVVANLYGLTSAAQKRHASKLIGEMILFLLKDCEFNAVPSRLVDFIWVFAIALRRAEEMYPERRHAADDVIREMHNICNESAYSTPMLSRAPLADVFALPFREQRTFLTMDRHVHACCAEDLAGAIMFLHRLGQDKVYDMVSSVCTELMRLEQIKEVEEDVIVEEPHESYLRVVFVRD